MEIRKAVLVPLLSIAVVLAVSLLTPTVRAQELLVHLPLDGQATNLGSAGAADIYTDDGAGRPQAVPGKIGQALLFDGPQAIAIPFNLDQTNYPRVTVTAWVKEEPGASGSRVIIWSGSSTGPRFELGGSLYSRVGREAVTYDGGSIPKNEWTFVATVVDAEAGSVRLLQSDTMEFHDNLETSIKAPYTFKDPNDPQADPQHYIFVGAPGFRWRSNNRVVALDDIRVYAGALSEAELISLRDSAGASSSGQIGDTETSLDAEPAPRHESGPAAGSVAGFRLDGEWVRRESNNNPNDGMRITVSGGQAVLTYVPPTASDNWHNGEIIWLNIDNNGALQVLGSDDDYYDAEIVFETADIVHIDIDANGRGNDQSWVRAKPAGLPGDDARLSAPDDLQELPPGMQADGTVSNANVPIACEQSEDCPDGQYCALEHLCHPNSHLPMANSADSGMTLTELQAERAAATPHPGVRKTTVPLMAAH